MKIPKLLYRLLVIILTAILIVSGCVVGRYVINSIIQKNAYNDLAAQVEQARGDALPTAPSAGSQDDSQSTVPTAPPILPEYAGLYEENPDLVGWMAIDGTSINYPVMQTPDRVDYYLYRNFKKESSDHGSLYVRESCDVFAPSDNLTIYGHHMKDGSMFADLEKYRKQTFREEYPTIRFDTIYTPQTYTIFAVFATTASVGQGFSYHLFEDAANEAEFNDFVATCKALSLYDTGITPTFGDKLICLSTCTATMTNGRLVVVAVRD